MKKFVSTNITTEQGKFYLKIKTLSINECLPICNGRTLYDCYTRPSNSKILAYDHCVRLARALINVIRSPYKQFSYDYLRFGYEYGISGFNASMFTFNANFYKDNILIGRLHCTHTKTELEIADDYTDLFDIEYLKKGC